MTQENTQGLTNNKLRDSSAKIIFKDPILCAQFLRDYVDIPLLKDVQPEDIEDETDRFMHLFTNERDSDVVKRVTLKKGKTSFYLVSLIEHKSEVDYNVVMQLNQYTNRKLMEKEDELSIIMMINKLQRVADFVSLKKDVPPEYLEKVTAGTPEYLLNIMEQIIEILLRKINVPQEEAAEFAGQVKERKMGELFANFEAYDVQATRAEARKEGLDEGLTEGLFAFVRTLKPILGDFDKVFDAITGNKEYANTTREEVMEFYQRCP